MSVQFEDREFRQWYRLFDRRPESAPTREEIEAGLARFNKEKLGEIRAIMLDEITERIADVKDGRNSDDGEAPVPTDS